MTGKMGCRNNDMAPLTTPPTVWELPAILLKENLLYLSTWALFPLVCVLHVPLILMAADIHLSWSIWMRSSYSSKTLERDWAKHSLKQVKGKRNAMHVACCYCVLLSETTDLDWSVAKTSSFSCRIYQCAFTLKNLVVACFLAAGCINVPQYQTN